MKKNDKKTSWVKQVNFNYCGYNSVLIGRRYPNNLFDPKRIMVYQMKDND